MVYTRPDLAHCLSVVSRYMVDLVSYHWQAIKWILRYVKGIISYGLLYTKPLSNQEVLTGFVDTDYATDKDKKRSLSGLVFKLFGNKVSWKSSLQSMVALSTIEVEYMALTEAFKEAIWLNELVEEFQISLKDDLVIFCDSQSADFCQRNQTYHERTKYIDVRFHFIIDVIAEGRVRIEKISSSENAVDVLRKTLPVNKLKSCLKALKVGSL
ncbi:secreted RxLR effector protein 161-like [Benincasa hispida]|uniref:secreted RxLR effector protein 161-like n=1 Tax=Benincasa hispida TaxID=102211 RepID=UPI0018FF2A1B|nr:secreted RxLR effector protein 161-like [Benincasa hispida]